MIKPLRGKSEKTIKEQFSERQKMAIDVAFKLLKILDGREAGNWKRVPQVKSAREETYFFNNFAPNKAIKPLRLQGLLSVIKYENNY